MEITQSEKFLPQITCELKTCIEKIIEEYEEKYNIHIFYASDTGSRVNGVAVQSSDFDANGFFIPDYKEYLKVISKYQTIISRQGIQFKLGDENFEVDILFWDIKDWLREKIEKNNQGFDYVIFSPLIYRNRHPELIDKIKMNIDPPFYYFWGKLKNNLDLCYKEIKKEGVQNKKIMNTLIYCANYLYCRIFEKFPDFNIFKLIEKFDSQREYLKTLLSEEELENLFKCFSFIEDCYEEKKKGRKSIRKDIPEIVMNLNNLLDRKFNGKKEKLTIINKWDAEMAQKLFDDLLAIYRK